MLTIHEQQRSFLKDGQPFFYLADTCWSAFTNIQEDDWEYYLSYRKQQGFNTLQINILPQWDACATALSHHPFLVDEKTQQIQLQEAYFTHARAMCERAVEKGFTLALVVLWCNYVPDTWASRMLPTHVLPFDFLETYLNQVHETFSDLQPVYIISGDTDFSQQSTPYYVKAINYLKSKAPACLYTTHIKGRYDVIPEELDQQLDFYFYQSGHNAQPENQGMAHRLATTFYHEKKKRPIINSEPCYEQMGFSHHMYGRFQQYDVRKAAWQSVLSGANAGITYGAAGIYSWHVQGMDAQLTSEGFDQPNSWQQAVLYSGAWDYGFLKELAQQVHLEDFQPYLGLHAKSKEICAASNADHSKILIYLPYSTSISIDLPTFPVIVRALGLKDKQIAYPQTKTADQQLVIGMHPFAEDALLIIERA